MGTPKPPVTVDSPFARAFLRACRLDVEARKPGNVSLASAGHGMAAELFVASAQASVGPLFVSGRPVGERIEGALRATFDMVHCNTNLGILLLCAPLAAASERWPVDRGIEALRTELGSVLSRLDVNDARAAYRAIALARPGGLGTSERQDVADEPTVTLLEAMAIAAGRDRIAWQYVNTHRDVFDLGLPAFRATFDAARRSGADAASAAVQAMQRAYLEFLCALPDSHIVRKHGEALAQSVMNEARPWCERVRAGESPQHDPAFAAWDETLKRRSINPGTSADLSVTTALLADWLHGAAGHEPT